MPMRPVSAAELEAEARAALRPPLRIPWPLPIGALLAGMPALISLSTLLCMLPGGGEVNNAIAGARGSLALLATAAIWPAVVARIANARLRRGVSIGEWRCWKILLFGFMFAFIPAVALIAPLVLALLGGAAALR